MAAFWYYTRRDCTRIIRPRADRDLRTGLAQQVLDLMDEVQAHLERTGIGDLVGGEALDQPLLKLAREFDEACPECGEPEGSCAGECLTCADDAEALMPDRMED